MPIINVQMLHGRTSAQKRAYIRAVAEVTMDILEVPEEAIRVVLTEVPPEHWGVGGRDMAEIRAGLGQPG